MCLLKKLLMDKALTPSLDKAAYRYDLFFHKRASGQFSGLIGVQWWRETDGLEVFLSWKLVITAKRAREQLCEGLSVDDIGWRGGENENQIFYHPAHGEGGKWDIIGALFKWKWVKTIRKWPFSLPAAFIFSSSFVSHFFSSLPLWFFFYHSLFSHWSDSPPPFFPSLPDSLAGDSGQLQFKMTEWRSS